MMNYSYPGANPCSMCKENTVDWSTACMTMIDCMAAMYPCTGNCETNCLNASHGDSTVATCADALKAAACQ
jgi:hypothetical protein